MQRARECGQLASASASTECRQSSHPERLPAFAGLRSDSTSCCIASRYSASCSRGRHGSITTVCSKPASSTWATWISAANIALSRAHAEAAAGVDHPVALLTASLVGVEQFKIGHHLVLERERDGPRARRYARAKVRGLRAESEVESRQGLAQRAEQQQRCSERGHTDGGHTVGAGRLPTRLAGPT
eukprot:scaffold281151_cov28-Tisochrysis_lutea.AAC.1